jgi:hypothetical protein
MNHRAIWDDPKELEEWTLFHLLKLDADDDEWHWRRLANFEREAASKPRNPLAAAVASAEYGNLGPLRKLFPEIAKFIHRPPAAPRKRGPKNNIFRDFALHDARVDVRRIHELWQEHFGRSYRRESPRATEIAAARHNLTERQLLNERKNRHRQRKR